MKVISWGDDLIPTVDNIGIESLDGQLTQGPSSDSKTPSYFNPINVVVENGIYYVNIYLCATHNNSAHKQKFLIWLASLKDTDYIKLTVSSLLIGVPIQHYIDILAAIRRSKATVDIQLDSIVTDELAYFYLIADKVTVGCCAGLFIPSYVDSRQEDKSTPWKVVHDFLSWIIEEAVTKSILTEEDADRLNSGKHVIIASAVFNTTVIDD